MAAVGWDERVADDRTLIRSESAELRPQVRAWRRLARRERERAGAAAAVAEDRRLAGDVVRDALDAADASLEPERADDARFVGR